MSEIFKLETAPQPLSFTGERFTTEASGRQIELEHLHRYLLAREFCRSKDVLDVASGEGYGPAILAQVAHSVIGVEIDQLTIAHSARSYPKANLGFACADARHLPFHDASFDLVTSFETLEHFAEQEHFLHEIKRVLRPQGMLIISTPDRDIYSPADKPANPFHVRELTREEFATALKEQFPHVHIYFQRPLIGSALMPSSPTIQPAPALNFERRDDGHLECNYGLARAVYIVAFASSQSISNLIAASLYISSDNIESAMSERDAARAEAETARTEAETARREAENLRTYLSGLRAEISQEESRNKQEIEKMQAALSNSKQEFQRSEAALSALRVESSHEQQRNKEEIGKLEAALAALRTETYQAEESSKRQIEAQHAAICAMQSEIWRAEERSLELSGYRAETERLNHELLQCKSDHARLSTQLLEVSYSRDQLRSDHIYQMARLEGILSSASWRITSPLRWVQQTFRAKYLSASPVRLFWWFITLQLARHMQIAKECELVIASGLFDTSFYLERNRELGCAGIDPLVHYMTRGGFEGRDPHILFDSDWYLEQNPEVAIAGTNPLADYLRRASEVGCNPHPLFDGTFYRHQNPDVAVAGVNPLLHYLTRGGFEGRDPHPLFDSDWYLEQNPEVAASGTNPLVDYLHRGSHRGCNPNALFDGDFYRNKNADLTQTGVDSLLHYLTQGGFEGRDPHILFDSDWYLEQNPEVAVGGTNPLVDYLQRGSQDNCNPHPLFDGMFYKNQNPDVARAGVNPLLHYLTRGGFEGRDPHPLFDSDWYLDQNPEVAAAGINPLVDYLQRGLQDNCNPHPLFDGTFYKNQNPDVARAGVNPLLHYLTRGGFEGRDPHPLFDTSFYLTEYFDVAASELNPLVHYAVFGAPEGRLPNRWFDKPWPQILPTVYGQREWEQYGRNRLNTLLGSTHELIFPYRESPEVSIILVFHNQAHLSVTCLDSILANNHCNYQVVIVDNGSTDATSSLLGRCRGVQPIRSETNLGFSKACNLGAAEARGKYLLFLNNDALLESDAIIRALQNFEDPKVGAVGGKILLADGCVQEAGSILWSDGSASGYGRGDQPDLPQYGFTRPVDYCSGAFLFTPRDLFFKLGGFDPMYSPAYYEDSDYCLKIWQSGLQVIFDPSCVIRHFESASSGDNLSARPRMAANRDVFFSKWKHELSIHCAPSMSNSARARIASQSAALRILYVDDQIPHRSLGAGFPRSNDILHQLARKGHHVTCVAMRCPLNALAVEYRDVARDIELIDGTRDTERLFREYVPNVDVLWVSRPHNLGSFLEQVTEFGGLSGKLVYDAEAIFSDRDRLLVDLRNRLVPVKVLEARIKRELALVRAADAVTVVSPRDQVLMEQEGVSNVHVLGHSLEAAPTRGCFRDRHAFLFVGALHGSENPNADSIRYFCSEIWPKVRRRTGGQLIIGGFGTDRYLKDLIEDGIGVVGPIENLTSVYNEARVFIAPTRYAAGLPFKVYEAAASGVPVVVSQLIGEQLGWTNGRDILVAQDADDFSNLCCKLYNDESLWHQVRANALARIKLELDPASFADRISTVLASIKIEIQSPLKHKFATT